MKHVQTEVRKLFEPEVEEFTFSTTVNGRMQNQFLYWLDRKIDPEEIKRIMEDALSSKNDGVTIFVGDNASSPEKYVAVSWNEDVERNLVTWGSPRPDPITKMTVKGKPSEMMADETIASLLLLIPDGVVT